MMTSLKKHHALRNFLLIFFLLYWSQGIYYPEGSMLSQVSLLVTCGISAYYALKVFLLRGFGGIFVKAWTFFLCMIVIWYVLGMDYANDFGQLKSVLNVMLIFYPVYYLSRNGVLSPKVIVLFFYSLLAMYILKFYYNERIVVSGRDIESITNNVGYAFVWLIPFLFVLKLKQLQVLMTSFVLLFFILLSAKRGAVIAASFGYLWFLIYSYILYSKGQRNMLYIYVVPMSFLIGLGYFLSKFIISYGFLQERFSTISEGSGRSRIYSQIYDYWSEGGSLNVLFGYGSNSAKNVTSSGLNAHSDWLQLLVDQGLFGVVAYLVLFGAAVSLFFRADWGMRYKFCLASILSMWFLVSIYSMGYTGQGTVTLMAFVLAYLLGSTSRADGYLVKNEMMSNK